MPLAAQQPPNILVIWGDDIGQSNISAYTRGLMGYHTPNIDRIANEGTTAESGELQPGPGHGETSAADKLGIS